MATTTDRILNKLGYAIENKAAALTSLTDGDRILVIDESETPDEVKYITRENLAADLVASELGISTTELGYIDGVTAGTVLASKAVVVDANKDASALRNLTLTNLDAGASGTAGTVDVFPSTASKGKLAISVTDQTGDTTVSLVVGAMAGATTVTLRDPGAAASILTTTDATAAATTSTAVELNKLDDSAVVMTKGAGVSAMETYASGWFLNGTLKITRIMIDLTGLVASTTDLDIIGNTGGAASAHLGQVTAANNGTIVGGSVTCLEVPAGGPDDIDFYSATVSTGAQDSDVTALTETVLITAGGAWASGTVKGFTTVPPANDYLYLANGEASVPGTYTAGKFLIELFGV